MRVILTKGIEKCLLVLIEEKKVLKNLLINYFKNYDQKQNLNVHTS